MRWRYLWLRAWHRGLLYEWPSQAPVPEGHSGVSCGLPTSRECKEMYRHGWEPWCFQYPKDPVSGERFVARLFIVWEE